jgi:hypothetical protein
MGWGYLLNNIHIPKCLIVIMEIFLFTIFPATADQGGEGTIFPVHVPNPTL